MIEKWIRCNLFNDNEQYKEARPYVRTLIVLTPLSIITTILILVF